MLHQFGIRAKSLILSFLHPSTLLFFFPFIFKKMEAELIIEIPEFQENGELEELLD